MTKHEPGDTRDGSAAKNGSTRLVRVGRRGSRQNSQHPHLEPVLQRDSLKVSAEDGVSLLMERYARPGAPPVLLLHGWMQSPRAMDTPVRGRSLARYLATTGGFDVFVGCFRGHGTDEGRSGSAGAFTPEDHAALDIPAFVSEIRRVTGRRPALIGHSLGGLTALFYLAGATRTAQGIVPDPRVAEARNGAVSAVVAIAPPLSFPARRIALVSERPDIFGRLLCLLGASRAGGFVLRRLPRLDLQAGLRALAGTPGSWVERLLQRAGLGAAARGLWHPENMSPELVASELDHTLDATSGAELRRLARWVVGGGLFEEGGTDWRPALESVCAPTMLVAGTRDGVATLEGIVRAGFGLIGSEVLELLMVEDAGHNDLRAGDKAVTEVFPAVAGWLASLLPAAGRARKPRSVQARMQPVQIA